MIVSYGSFAFSDNEAFVSFWGQQSAYDRRGNERIRRRRMVIEGEVIASGAANIESRIVQIENAFELGGQNAGLYIAPSTLTHINLDNATSLTGVRVVGKRVPQRDNRGDYATGLEFQFVLEADYLQSVGDELVDYEEVITYVGDGGPRKVVAELLNGPPITQYTTTQTAIVILQAGRAVGATSYPDINPSLIPSLLDRPEGLQITRGTPERVNGAYINWPVSWSYRMTVSTAQGVAAGMPAFPSPIQRDFA